MFNQRTCMHTYITHGHSLQDGEGLGLGQAGVVNGGRKGDTCNNKDLKEFLFIKRHH